MSLNKKPTQEEQEAMQRVRDKISEAGLEFDLLACVQLAKVFVHYKVTGFKIEDREVAQVDK